MSDLTLFVFSTPGYDPDETIRSVNVPDKKVVLLDERNLKDVMIYTEWFGFLMADEKLDEKLAAALPVYVYHDIDCIVMFKEVMDASNRRMVHFMTPRFFKNKVRFREDDLYPINLSELKCTRALDGLIIDVSKKC